MSALYSFRSHKFTNAGAVGRLGPTISQVRSAYSGVSWAQNSNFLSMDTQGIQKWKVPANGLYSIRAAGAAGGYHSFAKMRGGYGAVIESNIQLTKGSFLYIIVGQKGEDLRVSSGDVDNAAPGGGGGTFVYKNAYDQYPLIAAGGGGGGSRVYMDVLEASLTVAAKSSGNGTPGGTNGNGGGINQGSDYFAGGGSGWLTDGTGGNNPTLYNFNPSQYGAEGGRSPRNGAVGGIRFKDGNDEGGDGGFGGGGGGGSDNMGTGGGGGYSGGGGARTGSGNTENGQGGGGASYSMNKFTYSAVNNGGHGYVIITLLKPPDNIDVFHKSSENIIIYGVLIDMLSM